MEVKKLSVEVTAEGKLVSVSALFPSGNKIEADDVAELQRVLGELQGGPSAPTEAPPTGRRGRSSAPSAAAEATSPGTRHGRGIGCCALHDGIPF